MVLSLPSLTPVARLFLHKRKEQLKAAAELREKEDYAKQYELARTMLTAMFKVPFSVCVLHRTIQLSDQPTSALPHVYPLMWASSR